jgi:hypothetical protein
MLLERELAKILTYVADRKEITEQDVKSVGVHYSLPTGWQMAEQLVFEGRAGVKDPSFSLSDLLPLFGQLRYHLTNGRQVAFHHMVSASKEQISAHMPQLRSAMLDKYVALTSELGAPFFDRALEALFRVELLAKNSSFSAVFLWDYLSAQLSQIRSMYVRKR